ncbi:MAG: DUF1385 domain-containing protein [Calditrichaeota bacterium]|nr:MAG: DUF1385 domain-containing protein [Calditrichota bacterium]
MVLIESVVLGVKALTFSSDVAMEDEKPADADVSEPASKKKGIFASIWLGVTVLFSFAAGLLVFFYLPLLVTEWTGVETGVMFNLVVGALRLSVFLPYLWGISRIRDIRRIFEYHGAEHKSIFAFETKKPLLPAAAKDESRFHPRCGTSFLLIVMVVSVLVFMFLGKPATVAERLLRLAFVPLIGGLSYELIRLSDSGAQMRFWRTLILPGLWLQRLTTREPDETQLEVAIVALKSALGLDLSDHPAVVLEERQALGLETAA